MHLDEKQKPSYFTLGIIIFVITLIMCIPCVSRSQLTEVSEERLSQVSAQSGINYVFGETGIRATQESFRISDTDHDPAHWMEFNNFSVDDGQGGYFSMDTPYYGLLSPYYYNTIDIGTDDDGQTLVMMNLSTHYEPRTYTVGNFVFCNQDLGSIRLANVQHDVDKLIIGARTDGQCGIDMEYQTKIDIESIVYNYNNQPTSLRLSGIHLSEYALGSPEDPTSWVSLGEFKIGDMAHDNPVTIDVATIDDIGTSVFINIPMTGSARVEGVEFDGKNFGPCAIDGIKVHYLGIQLPGN